MMTAPSAGPRGLCEGDGGDRSWPVPVESVRRGTGSGSETEQKGKDRLKFKVPQGWEGRKGAGG